MDQKTITSICRQVYQKFPEVRGSSPKLRPLTSESTLLIFEGKATAADGREIRRTVRAVVNAAGKITKLTTSR
jgi:hypothetical protein